MGELLVKTLLFAALSAAAFVPLEHVVRRRAASRRRFAADIAFATVGQFATRAAALVLVGAALAALDTVALERAFGAGIEPPPLRGLCQLAVGLVAFELGGYAYHRAAHALPWLWRLHAVHHSSRDMDFLAAFRQHPLEILLMTLLQNAPLVLIGIPFGSHASVAAVLRLHTVLLHANVRLPQGPWSEVVAMPRFHQRHHARRGRAVNFASLLPVLDRIFGSHDDTEAHAFGVDAPMPETFGGLLLYPLPPAVLAATTGDVATQESAG